MAQAASDFLNPEREVAVKIGRLLAKARAQSGLSYPQVAEATGMFSSQIHRLENGLISKPALMDILTLANFYRIPLARIVSEVGFSPFGPPERITNPKVAMIYTLIDAALKAASEDQLDYLTAYLKIFNKSLAMDKGGDQ